MTITICVKIFDIAVIGTPQLVTVCGWSYEWKRDEYGAICT